MIITELNGGIGNQMFQYAIGRAISIQKDIPLKLDIRKTAADPLRTYRLNHLNICSQIATADEINEVIPQRSSHLFRRSYFHLKNKCFPYIFKTRFVEKGSVFDSEIFKIKSKNIFLSGYWQSEKYFIQIADLIREEFTPKNQLNEVNKEVQKKIYECNSVSLHIRRGDYITNPVTNSVHGTISVAYYEKAIAYIASQVKAPFFYIFSDDFPWVETHLKINYPFQYVNHNGPELDYEDIRLMSACKHHIIANSSFSWWGAWLSKNPNKIVIAPEKWFNIDIDNSDRLPASWVKL